MKGEATLKIFECIGDAVIDVVDLTIVFLNAGYGASAGEIKYQFDKKSRENLRKRKHNAEERRQRRRFSSMFYRLKNDGLIEEKLKDSALCVTVTQKGRRYFEMLKKRRANALPDTAYNEPGRKDGKFAIVVFDIPERERRKRAWLRLALKNIGFNLIQKSVWAGKVSIPREFLDDLKELQLIEYVEIFEISKAGSLRQLT